MNSSNTRGTGRRAFLKTVGSAVAAATVVPNSENAFHTGPRRSSTRDAGFPAPGRKIPIGVFDVAYADLSLDETLDKISALGIEAIEVGTGGYPGSPHCPVDELLADSGKLKAWKKKFEDKNIRLATLSCHGNPVHPDESVAQHDAETFRKTVQLAERLGVQVIVGFSGCPAGSPATKRLRGLRITGRRSMPRPLIGNGKKK